MADFSAMQAEESLNDIYARLQELEKLQAKGFVIPDRLRNILTLILAIIEALLAATEEPDDE